MRRAIYGNRQQVGGSVEGFSVEGFGTPHLFWKLRWQPFRAHVYFSVPGIVGDLRANPIGNLQVLIRLREFNFGNYNTLQNIVVDIDLPSCVFLDDKVPHLVQNVQGIAYSNSVRTIPILRLFTAIVALSSAMRTLALLPLLLPITQSRIFECRTTYFFHPSCATRNLRSISSGIASSLLLGSESLRRFATR